MLVHVFLGSKSDEKHIRASQMAKVLDGVVGEDQYAVHVCSAHRNAKELAEFVEGVLQQGTKALVGVAGLAAALPGALAAHSEMILPVYGVPLDQDGIDSCLKMPPGVPVHLMGVGGNGLTNAALGVCQMLAESDDGIAERYRQYLTATAKEAEFHIDKERIRPEPSPQT